MRASKLIKKLEEFVKINGDCVIEVGTHQGFTPTSSNHPMPVKSLLAIYTGGIAAVSLALMSDEDPVMPNKKGKK